MSTQLAAPLDLTVMMYHYVRDPGDAAEAGSGIPGLSLARFTAQLDQLAERYVVVSWPEVRAALLGRQPLPRGACLLTFDDGVRDHYLNVFPALRARGLSGLFFALARAGGEGLTTAHKIHFLLAALGFDRLRQAAWDRMDAGQQTIFTAAERGYRVRRGALDSFKTALQRDLCGPAEVILSALYAEHVGDEAGAAAEYYLSQAQAREMLAGGMHLGGHSHSHPWFDWIDAEEQASEVAASAAWLRAAGEPEPWAFAYPFGGLSETAPHHLAAHGFAAAFTTVEQVRHTDPYYIGRLDGEEWTAASTRPEGAPHG